MPQRVLVACNFTYLSQPPLNVSPQRQVFLEGRFLLQSRQPDTLSQMFWGRPMMQRLTISPYPPWIRMLPWISRVETCLKNAFCALLVLAVCYILSSSATSSVLVQFLLEQRTLKSPWQRHRVAQNNSLYLLMQITPFLTRKLGRVSNHDYFCKSPHWIIKLNFVVFRTFRKNNVEFNKKG